MVWKNMIQGRCVFFLFLFFNISISFSQSLLPLLPQGVTFSGDFRAEFQHDDIDGRPQYRPKNIWLTQFTPQITIPGLPQINLNISLSSLESSQRQSFNRYLFQLKPRWGALYFGDSYPIFSKYTLNGIVVRGFSSDIQLGHFNLAMTAGQSKRAVGLVPGMTQTMPSFDQHIYGIRIGAGKKEGNRIHINFIQAADDSASIQPLSFKRPRENVVTSLDGLFNIIPDKIAITGEIAAGAYSRDVTARAWNLPPHVPHFARKIFTPRASSQYDLAGFAEVRASLNQFRMTLTMTQIGPGFYSLGTAWLHNDIRKLAANVSQRMWHNKVYFNAGLDYAHDNLGHLKNSTARATYLYGGGAVTLKSLPSLNLYARRHTLKNNNTDILAANNRLNTVQATLSKSFRLLSLDHTSMLTSSKSWYRSATVPFLTSRDYDSQNLRLSLTSSLQFSFSVTASIGHVKTTYKAFYQNDKRWLYNLGVTHKAFKGRLLSYCGFSYDEGKANEYYRSVTQDTTFGISKFSIRKKKSFYLRSDWKSPIGTCSIKVERMLFSSSLLPQDNYREFIARVIYTRQFGKTVDLLTSRTK